MPLPVTVLLRIGAASKPFGDTLASMFSRHAAAAGNSSGIPGISSTNPKKFGGKDPASTLFDGLG